MRLLVTGASGMLGRDVVALAERTGHEVSALPRAELDVTDAEAVEGAIAAAPPDAVISCAAWTDVDGAERSEDEAAAVNASGAENVARAAASVGAKLLYPSTDYVFDGSKEGAYVESDSPGPLNAYGRTKLAGERTTAEVNERAFIVRTSWLFGTGGRNFLAAMVRLGTESDSVDVVRDQVGCPTYTAHLAAGLLRLLDSEAYGIHHMAGAGACSWAELAEEVFSQAAVACEVNPVTSEALPRPAIRPPNSALASERQDAVPLPAWQHGVGDYLAARARAEARGAVS